MILVTGASGIVGSAIADYFVGHGEDVIMHGFGHAKQNMIYADLTDEKQLVEMFEKYEISAIVHCAAIRPGNSGNSDIFIYKNNMGITLNLLSYINKDVFFINISGTSIYNLVGDGVLNEYADIKCDTLYQLSKKHSEDLFGLYCTDNILNLRISSPYSINRENDSILYKFIRKAISKEPLTIWGSGRRTQAFTNVYTLAEDLYKLYSKKITGTFNYVTTPSISMLNLANEVAKNFEPCKVVQTGNDDPEEFCRTSISINKISGLINPKDTLASDIAIIAKKYYRK